MVARGLGRGYWGVSLPPPLVPALSAAPEGVERMLWAGTHPGGHKLEEERNVTKDPGPSPSSYPARLAPLDTPSIAPTQPRAVPRLTAWSLALDA